MQTISAAIWARPGIGKFGLGFRRMAAIELRENILVSSHLPGDSLRVSVLWIQLRLREGDFEKLLLFVFGKVIHKRAAS